MTVRVIHGDCRDVLAGFEAESFAACICDPPYHLTADQKGGTGIASLNVNSPAGRARISTGFMGRVWDGGDVAFRSETWAAVWRVLKPGAHLVAFGGTRTYHRMVCAIEDAGFEIRDQLAWVYGCLSEDTEILIDGQWEPYHKAIAGRRALCYDAEHDEYSWQPIDDLFVYDYDDTAFRIISDRTDQLVSRNHRCLVERGGALVFELAEEAARERQARVPILENLPELLGDLSMPDERASREEQGLWPVLCQSAAFDTAAALHQTARRTQRRDDLLRGMWDGSLEARCLAETDRDPGMLAPMQRPDPWTGVGQARLQGSIGLDGSQRGELSAEDERSQQPCLEGRGDVLPQAWQLQADQVRPLSARVPADGTQGRLRDGASSDRGEGDRALPTQGRGGSSRGPRSAGQRLGQPDAVREQPGSQALRASRHTRTDLARIEPVHYRGVVWCVKVPTGAFVARRNGKVFVTGNSGFPKSLNVQQAMNKAARGCPQGSADPSSPNHGKFKGGCSEENEDGRGFGAGAGAFMREQGQGRGDDEGPWQGWGTALKPAHEPVVVCSKPVTAAQHFAMIIRELTLMIIEGQVCCGVSANDVAKNFSDIQAMLQEVGESTVLDGARMRSLESIGIAPYVAMSSTFSGLVSLDWIRTKGCSALSHVRQTLSEEGKSGETTPPGREVDILTRLMAMSTSVMLDGISANTVLSWRSISTDLLSVANTFTIETVSKLTIALRTLSLSMLPNIIGGTGDLSPNLEPIVLARKPLSEGTVAANVLRWGTGALNIDAARVGYETDADKASATPGGRCTSRAGTLAGGGQLHEARVEFARPEQNGRWPPNLAHDGSPEVMEAFAKFGESMHGAGHAREAIREADKTGMWGLPGDGQRYGDTGSPARFFFCGKATKDDRMGTTHPTTKPTELIKWLCKMVNPPGGTILDPFAGSGTLAVAATRLGMDAVLIDSDPESIAMINQRLRTLEAETPLFPPDVKSAEPSPSQLRLFA